MQNNKDYELTASVFNKNNKDSLNTDLIFAPVDTEDANTTLNKSMEFIKNITSPNNQMGLSNEDILLVAKDSVLKLVQSEQKDLNNAVDEISEQIDNIDSNLIKGGALIYIENGINLSTKDTNNIIDAVYKKLDKDSSICSCVHNSGSTLRISAMIALKHA